MSKNSIQSECPLNSDYYIFMDTEAMKKQTETSKGYGLLMQFDNNYTANHMQAFATNMFAEVIIFDVKKVIVYSICF